jgi:YggT family protein
MGLAGLPGDHSMSGNLASLINFFFTVLSIAIIGRALLSWFDPGFRTPIGKIIYDVTEPVVGPIRRVIPTLGMFDISPIVALLLIRLLATLLNQALTS